MQKNDVGSKTLEIITKDYENNRKNGSDYIFNNIPCVVISVNYDSSRSSIITKIARKDDIKIP